MMKHRFFNRFLCTFLAMVMVLAGIPAAAANSQYISIDCSSLTLVVGESYSFQVTGSTKDGMAYTKYDSAYLSEGTTGFSFTALKAGRTVIEFRSTDDTVVTPCNVTILESHDTLTAVIDGAEQTLTLRKVYLNTDTIFAYYTNYTPRGEVMYSIGVRFNKYFHEGTYSTLESILYTDVDISFSRGGDDPNTTYTSYRRQANKSAVTGTFTIESVSDDLNEYTCSFTADLADNDTDDIVTITDAKLNFRINGTTGGEVPEIEYGENMLSAFIDGKEIVFTLNSVKIQNNNIIAIYTHYNARGEAEYVFHVKFNKYYGEGTYTCSESMIKSKVNFSFKRAADGIHSTYSSSRTRANNSVVTGSLTIDYRCDEWNTYEGTFSVDLARADNGEILSIKDAKFNFTINP